MIGITSKHSPTGRTEAVSSFLRLPPEIRREIYVHLLVQPTPIVLNYLGSTISPRRVYLYLGNWADFKISSAILCVSKQIAEEALDVLYGCNLFEIRPSEADKTSLITPHNRNRIKRLQILLQPMGVWYRKTLDLSPEIWGPILRKAAFLRIIAEQPAPRYGAPIDFWQERLRTMLSYLTQYLANVRSVEFDYDNRKETGQAIEDWFPNHRNMPTHLADRYFSRGEWYAFRQG